MKPQILPSYIEEEMQRSYLDYAMSVIVGRALPDVRDGLKPVHRRILYAMKLGGYESSKPHKKSARVVGDVMSQFHPHGDAAIYDAMVRMAQEFSMRLPLIDGQGNFGSVDGDPPAAMRYTEARLMPVAEAILVDTDQHTVKFQPNYDESTTEPTVLASRVPNLMVNGSSGIAVGMATNIPPHNLGEVVDGCCALIDNPELSGADLLQYVHGPDFPTGAMIMGRKGIAEAYRSGRGSITLRACTDIEELRKDRMAVIITEIPYQVNKARMLERIGEAVNNKTLSGIADIRDESDRDGLRVVIELKRDAVPEVVRNQLFQHTQLQTTFAINTLALRDGRPELLDLRTALSSFLVFREQVIRLRSENELEKAKEQAHLLIGFAVTVDNLDSMIELIKYSSDSAAAREAMLARRWEIRQAAELMDNPQEEGYRFSELQVRAILELRLSRLTNLEREKSADSLRQIIQRIDYYQGILGDRSRLLALMRDELLEIKQRFGSTRRSEIVELDDDLQLSDEDLISREDMVVTVSHSGYVKRVSLSSYRAQQRGGKGRSGMRVLSEDAVAELFIASTHDSLLLFSTRGLAYRLKVYRLPLSAPQSSGKSLRNLLPLSEGERISATLILPEARPEAKQVSIVFGTAKGYVRRNRMSDFENIRSNGLVAMKLQDDDRLISAVVCQEPCDILLATRRGKCIRFQLEQLRIFSGRSSSGVRGVRLMKDEVISLSVLHRIEASAEERDSYLKLRNRVDDKPDEPLEPSLPFSDSLSEEYYLQLAQQEELILTVSDRGFGKLSSAYEYRTSARGGQGIWSMKVSARVGNVAAAIFPVSLEQEIMLVTERGQIIRMPVQGLRIAGRHTSGVTLFRIDDQERIVSVAIIPQAIELEEDSAA